MPGSKVTCKICILMYSSKRSNTRECAVRFSKGFRTSVVSELGSGCARHGALCDLLCGCSRMAHFLPEAAGAFRSCSELASVISALVRIPCSVHARPRTHSAQFRYDDPWGPITSHVRELHLASHNERELREYFPQGTALPNPNRYLTPHATRTEWARESGVCTEVV